MAVDTSALTYKAKSDDTLLPQPENPKFRVALIGCYVDSHPTGGSDKLTNGHRFDTVAIANGLINSGIACQIIFYNVAEHDKFFEVVAKFDGIVIRVNPGQITANGGSQQKFDDDMMKVAAKIPVWPTPETMSKMGAKDALCQIKHMDFGLQDTLGYYSPEGIASGFRKTIAFQPRVVKQNRGSAGEGIWIIKLKSGEYCDQYCDKEAGDDEVLICKEANDNHVEEHTVAEFIEFCVNGRTDKSGTWTSVGTGKYFEGGVEAGGQMVDQRFLPRIDEGEARFVMIGRQLNRVEHYVYIGGVGGETKTTIYKPGEEGFPYADIQKKLQDEVPVYLKALGLPDSALPLLWAADLIPVDNHKSPYVIGEFNCSCLGLAGFLNVRGKDISELKDEDRDLGMKMANLIGEKCLESLEKAKILASIPASLGQGPYKARFQQTMLRIKDPKVSVPWYIENFNMTLIHWMDYPQWKFTVYFLEVLQEGQVVPPCTMEKSTAESERYLFSMNGHAIELTHNHGSESDPNFKVWSGNTGKDASGDLYAEEPATRGFGHVAFNCDDVYKACEKLEANGVKFQKKPDDGRMKGLAFALDPDGYWLEIVKRKSLGWKPYFNLSQTMLRVKDGPKTVEFFTKHLGFTLIRQMDFADAKFSLFFLASVTKEELDAALKLDEEAGGVLDPLKPNELTKILFNSVLELTWNHGTENDENFKIHDGNAQPQGFGHIGMIMDNLEAACDEMEANGVKMKKKPRDGNMRNLAFCWDPNGYSIEMIDRVATFAGICTNY